MSKIGKNPIQIPQGVEVQVDNNIVTVKGPKGELTAPVLKGVIVTIADGQVSVAPENQETQTTMNWGTTRSLINNAVAGAVQEFTKVLELEGVGYRATMEGTTLVLKVGFSHLVKFPAPQGIVITAEKNTITIVGADKQMVGHVAAQIRKIKKPEPYLGKGIHYKGEVIRRKAGKKAASASA